MKIYTIQGPHYDILVNDYPFFTTKKAAEYLCDKWNREDWENHRPRLDWEPEEHGAYEIIELNTLD